MLEVLGHVLLLLPVVVVLCSTPLVRMAEWMSGGPGFTVTISRVDVFMVLALCWASGFGGGLVYFAWGR